MFGSGDEEYAMPWNKLTYHTGLGGYRTDVTEAQLRGAPKGPQTDFDGLSSAQIKLSPLLSSPVGRALR
jgi:hypothetical protein